MSAFKPSALACDVCGEWDDFGIDRQPAKLAEVRKASQEGRVDSRQGTRPLPGVLRMIRQNGPEPSRW